MIPVDGAAPRRLLREVLPVGDTVRSRDVDELTARVQAHTSEHDVALRAGSPDGLVSWRRIGAVDLVYIRYGAEVVIATPPVPDRCSITVPIGPMRVLDAAGRATAVVAAGNAFVIDQRTAMTVQPHPTAGSLVISMPMTLLEDRLAGLSSGAVATGLRFTNTARSGDRGGPGAIHLRSAWQQVCCALRELEDAELHPAVGRAFESMLVTGALLGLPHNHSDELVAGGPRSAEEPAVARARAWIHRHYAEEIGVADIAAAAGTSIRTVQYCFARSCGVSPTEYLRGYRLDRARELLVTGVVAGGPRIPVTAVATRCGMPHLGRFAESYKERFGELPSGTVRRLAHRRPGGPDTGDGGV